MGQRENAVGRVDYSFRRDKPTAPWEGGTAPPAAVRDEPEPEGRVSGAGPSRTWAGRAVGGARCGWTGEGVAYS